MGYNYRELVEALDEITSQEDESFSVETPSDDVVIDLLKDITKCLIHCVDKVKSGEDVDEIAEKLQKARDILDDMKYNDESTEAVEEDCCYGTEDMAPTIGKDGVQDYSVKDAPSYAARHGFVGM
ncbi:hypothetical protein [Escherichia phage vB_EcoM_JNE01]|nr:hypothetical protein [Escherichia phage vB_EcoM_JNE01]